MTTESKTIRPSSLRTLQPRLTGEVVRPGDAEYEEARQVKNRLFDKRPDVIVRAEDASDVIRAVLFARANDLPIAIRSGAHSLAGFGTVDHGIVIDVSGMKGVRVDVAAKTAWAQSGLTAGELTAELEKYGFIIPTGDTSSVGVAGLTLGGGIGYVARGHGMTIDHLIGVELVTADGELVTASESENSDLFWAIRGGGGNFGVVTAFHFKLIELPAVYGGTLMFPATVEIVRNYIAAAKAAPEGVTTIGAIMFAPPAPFVPEEVVGQLSLWIGVCYAGGAEEGVKAVAGLRAIGTATADALEEMPYSGMYAAAEEATGPHRAKVRQMFVDDLSDEAIETILVHAAKAPSPMSLVELRPLGGQMARVSPDATAFKHRERELFVAVIGFWQKEFGPDEAQIDWTLGLWDQISHLRKGAYVNFVDLEGEERVRETYGEDTYARLARVKAEYDPENVFAQNQNIKPAVTAHKEAAA